MTNATDQARAILGQTDLPADLRPLVGALEVELEFGLARKLLEKALARAAQDRWVVQQLALATYKDEELVPRRRFARALALLRTIGLGDEALSDRETLALGGAIYKRMWEQGGQLEDLHAALALYTAAWQRGRPEIDVERRLYAAVNAAFILDLLAARARSIARRAGTDGDAALELAARARALRQQALPLAAQRRIEALPSVTEPAERYWVLVTFAELHFGLANWSEADAALERASGILPHDSWAVQTTLRQLVALARALDEVPAPPEEGLARADWHPAWRALARLVDDEASFALTNHRGKVGLALSGGGFRASLFHLGVLARLAEMDVLRSVDVLSTVSGGSIVGAHYYLEVQRLLESKRDSEIVADDYLEIVRRVQREFYAGVCANMRMRTLTNLWANIRMAFSHHYTRSNRLGELYEKHLYRRVEDGRGGAERVMPDLLVNPAGEAQPFKPRFGNWRRRAKVPVLLLNATSLNSGHNWQFTGRWMGEPPEAFDASVDMNERYRRLWYEQAPTDELRRWRAGNAVAASACVPGLFEPLVLAGLYPDRTVRLVDGGVHDNQGVDGLLSEDCTLVLVSDASGQMADMTSPPDNRLGVPLRSNSILMDRVREAEYQDLRARVQSQALKGLFFVHMKQGLDLAPLDWVDCDDPSKPAAQPVTVTPYGIDKTLQRGLAAVRTDLDSFSEVEAGMLMLSGYLMTERQFLDLQDEHQRSGEPGTWGGYKVAARRGDWPFLVLEELARQPPASGDTRRRDLGRQIEIASKLFFRVWFLSPVLRALALAAGAAAAIALVVWLGRHWTDRLDWCAGLTVWHTVITVLVFLGAIVAPALRWLMPQNALRGVTAKLVLAVLGWGVGHLHLWLFDPLFLRLGRVARLLRKR